MDAYKLALDLFSLLALSTVVLPLVKKDHWIFRIFDYPRLQKFILIGVALFLWIGFYRETRLWYELIVIAVLLSSFLYLGYRIVPFTPLGRKMIAKSENKSRTGTLNVLVANVYQYNDAFNRLLSLISDRDPDIIFLLETDKKWLDAMQELKADYPHAIEVPLDNTYGLLFYSRLPLSHKTVNYLIDNEIPSIVADIPFKGETVRIFGVHPAPPVPQEAKYSTDRDAELLMVGQEAKRYKGPCIVMGDLNDVAWSYTTKLFLKSSGLLDPRRGRGMYSTFHAKYFLLRWPLDHFFVSKHFHLVDMRVERHIGSDHFPISISLVLSDEMDAHTLKADPADKELVAEKIEAGINNEPR
ncbi:MAG TPA: endonuclease/exonuclease/phosphatase family protein [Flavobacterium sp.]|jgi:endonuclease/exonuclease/phosphatase (EEP) superfamily protein YafD